MHLTEIPPHVTVDGYHFPQGVPLPGQSPVEVPKAHYDAAWVARYSQCHNPHCFLGAQLPVFSVNCMNWIPSLFYVWYTRVGDTYMRGAISLPNFIRCVDLYGPGLDGKHHAPDLCKELAESLRLGC